MWALVKYTRSRLTDSKMQGKCSFGSVTYRHGRIVRLWWLLVKHRRSPGWTAIWRSDVKDGYRSAVLDASCVIRGEKTDTVARVKKLSWLGSDDCRGWAGLWRPIWFAVSFFPWRVSWQVNSLRRGEPSCVERGDITWAPWEWVMLSAGEQS